jgi:hypothetical protein
LCRAFEECDREAREVAAEKNCQLLDMAPKFEEGLNMFLDHVHLNEAGSKALAAAVAAEMRGMTERADAMQTLGRRNMGERQ